MNLTLHVWRQASANAKGSMERYEARDIAPEMSFLEMLDVVNEGLVERGAAPIAFDRIIAAGGFISAPTGSAQDANAIPVAKSAADDAMDAAACIGCGACVAACPNGSASLFTAAKVSHLGLLPQGQPERHRRASRMVAQMDAEGFGHCTLYGECQDACPKEISIDTIARMNRDFMVATLTAREEKVLGGAG
jgi:succinate dehydrogenase / fumarate reductase iron-sulfur subunit